MTRFVLADSNDFHIFLQNYMSLNSNSICQALKRQKTFIEISKEAKFHIQFVKFFFFDAELVIIENS